MRDERPKRVLVMLCMNDDRNGNNLERCCGIHVQHDDDLFTGTIELESDVLAPPSRMTVCRYIPRPVSQGGSLLQFSRRRFRCRGWREWIGNWCWNGTWMERAEAKRFIAYAVSYAGFTITAGPDTCDLLPLETETEVATHRAQLARSGSSVTRASDIPRPATGVSRLHTATAPTLFD